MSQGQSSRGSTVLASVSQTLGKNLKLREERRPDLGRELDASFTLSWTAADGVSAIINPPLPGAAHLRANSTGRPRGVDQSV